MDFQGENLHQRFHQMKIPSVMVRLLSIMDELLVSFKSKVAVRVISKK